MNEEEWHRIFNIMDARHDAKKCSGIRGPSIKDHKLFKDALILLFGESWTNDKPHFANGRFPYYINVIEGEQILNPLTNTHLEYGQQDNMLPTKFKMQSVTTLSQMYDPAPFTYDSKKPVGFPNNGNNNEKTTSLTEYGFNNWYLRAVWTDSSRHTEFSLYYKRPDQQAPSQTKLNFNIIVDVNGKRIRGNHTDPKVLRCCYIAGNTEKNEAISNNNKRYQIERSKPYTQPELLGYITPQSRNDVTSRIFNSSVGRIASKIVGDLGHFFTEYPVCSTDTYLALRGARLRKACILKHITDSVVTFRYFPGGDHVMAHEAHTRTDNDLRGVYTRSGEGGSLGRPAERVFGFDPQDSRNLGYFGWHHLKHTRVNNIGNIHEELKDNRCTDEDGRPTPCNRTTTEATCYADYTTSEGVIIVNPDANGVYTRTRSRTAPLGITLQYTDEYLETPNLLLNTVSTALVCLTIAVAGGMIGGGDKMPMKEEVSKHSDMKLNQQKRYLTSEYEKYISHLSKFLAVNKVRISGEKEEIECPAHIVKYIQHVIAMFTAHKESALESVKTDEDIFRWVPSQIIFHTDFMKIPQYTEGPAYYAPLKVPKLFPHLDDATVLKSFELENKFGAYSTFYEFFTESEDKQPAYVIPYTPPLVLVFKELLDFLDGEYSYKKEVKDMTDEIPTNFGDGGVKFAEQIRWFKKNGVTLENSKIFAALLADTMSRQCIGATQIAPIIFKELAKGDILLGYTLYNQCYPHLFASTKYFISFDIYIDLVTRLNSSDEIKHDLLDVIESKQQQNYANRLLEHVTGLASKLKITTEDSLYEYCKTLTVTEEDLYEFGDTVNELLVYPSGASPVFLRRFGEISNKMFEIIKAKNKQNVGLKSKKSDEKTPYAQKKPEYIEELPEDIEELPEPPGESRRFDRLLITPPAGGGRKTFKRIKKHSKRVNDKHKKTTRRKTVKRKTVKRGR